MAEENVWAKSESFRRYRRAIKLIKHNEELKRPEFVEVHKRVAEKLSNEFPDFPATLAEIEAVHND